MFAKHLLIVHFTCGCKATVIGSPTQLFQRRSRHVVEIYFYRLKARPESFIRQPGRHADRNNAVVDEGFSLLRRAGDSSARNENRLPTILEHTPRKPLALQRQRVLHSLPWK